MAESLKLEENAPYLELAKTAKSLRVLSKGPYKHDLEGWELIDAIGIAMGSFDFLTETVFALDAIQRRMRECLLRDAFVERTIYGLSGVSVDRSLQLGERAWVVSATLPRRTHVADSLHPTYPMIHCQVSQQDLDMTKFERFTIS